MLPGTSVTVSALEKQGWLQGPSLTLFTASWQQSKGKNFSQQRMQIDPSAPPKNSL